jgi:hypothetical protein
VENLQSEIWITNQMCKVFLGRDKRKEYENKIKELDQEFETMTANSQLKFKISSIF